MTGICRPPARPLADPTQGRRRTRAGQNPLQSNPPDKQALWRPARGTLARRRSRGRAGGVLIDYHQTMATFQRPTDMLVSRAYDIGPDATTEQAERLFDALVRRGLLRPWQHGFWQLATLRKDELRAIIELMS